MGWVSAMAIGSRTATRILPPDLRAGQLALILALYANLYGVQYHGVSWAPSDAVSAGNRLGLEGQTASWLCDYVNPRAGLDL